MSSKKKIVAVVITSVALTAGSFGISSAATKSTTRVAITNPMTANGAGRQGHAAEVAAVLAGLVTKGTITQAQADAINAALATAEAAEHANDPVGQKGPGVPADRAAIDALIATTIGIDAATIKSRLAAGETLGAIAGAKKDALIAALVADETKRIDAAVTAGKLTAAQATTLKSTLTAHVTEEVNAIRPPKQKGGRGHDEMGPMGGKAPTIPTPTASKAALKKA